MAAFSSFFLLLSMRISFFQFFFLMMMMIQGNRKYISLVTVLFFSHFTSSSMSFSRHIVLCQTRSLENSEKPRVPGSACMMEPDGKSYMKQKVFGKNHSGCTLIHFKVLTWEASSGKTLHLWEASTTCGQGSPGEYFLGIVENVL